MCWCIFNAFMQSLYLQGMANIDLMQLTGLWLSWLVSCKICSAVGWAVWSLRSGSGGEFEEMRFTS